MLGAANTSVTSSLGEGAAAADGGRRSRAAGQVRVLPPAPPYAPVSQAIPSTVTTPTIHAEPRAHGREGAIGGSTANSSFVSAAMVYVTAAAAAEAEGEGEETGAVSSPASTEARENPAVAAPEVDRTPAMIGYFGYLFGCASIDAFLGLILNTEKGFSKTAVGLLVSAVPLYKILLLPVLSFVADKYNCAAQMLSVCAVGSTTMVLLFTLAKSTGLALGTYFVLITFQTPMNPLLDKHTLVMFPPKGRTAAWGYVRSYGAYGWGVGNPIAGLLTKWTGTWVIAAPQYALGQAALLYCMYTTQPYEKLDHAVSSSVKFKDVLRVLYQHPRLLLFLFASCMMGMGYSCINNYLFIFLDELGGSTFLMGITLLVTVSTEIPIFQNSERLHEWFTERWMMSLAMLLWTCRVLGYSFLHNPWIVLFLEPLHGVTFGLMWLPGVKLISETFPPELASSATGVLFTFVSGFGAIIGNVLAGVLYDAVGARMMFRIAAATMMTAFVCYLWLDRHLERKGYVLGKPQHGGSDGGGGGVTAAAVVIVEAAEEAGKDDSPTVTAAVVPKTAASFSINKWEEKNVRVQQS